MSGFQDPTGVGQPPIRIPTEPELQQRRQQQQPDQADPGLIFGPSPQQRAQEWITQIEQARDNPDLSDDEKLKVLRGGWESFVRQDNLDTYRKVQAVNQRVLAQRETAHQLAVGNKEAEGEMLRVQMTMARNRLLHPENAGVIQRLRSAVEDLERRYGAENPEIVDQLFQQADELDVFQKQLRPLVEEARTNLYREVAGQEGYVGAASNMAEGSLSALAAHLVGQTGSRGGKVIQSMASTIDQIVDRRFDEALQSRPDDYINRGGPKPWREIAQLDRDEVKQAVRSHISEEMTQAIRESGLDQEGGLEQFTRRTLETAGDVASFVGGYGLAKGMMSGVKNAPKIKALGEALIRGGAEGALTYFGNIDTDAKKTLEFDSIRIAEMFGEDPNRVRSALEEKLRMDAAIASGFAASLLPFTSEPIAKALSGASGTKWGRALLGASGRSADQLGARAQGVMGVSQGYLMSGIAGLTELMTEMGLKSPAGEALMPDVTKSMKAGLSSRSPMAQSIVDVVEGLGMAALGSPSEGFSKVVKGFGTFLKEGAPGAVGFGGLRFAAGLKAPLLKKFAQYGFDIEAGERAREVSRRASPETKSDPMQATADEAMEAVRQESLRIAENDPLLADVVEAARMWNEQVADLAKEAREGIGEAPEGIDPKAYKKSMEALVDAQERDASIRVEPDEESVLARQYRDAFRDPQVQEAMEARRLSSFEGDRTEGPTPRNLDELEGDIGLRRREVEIERDALLREGGDASQAERRMSAYDDISRAAKKSRELLSLRRQREQATGTERSALDRRIRSLANQIETIRARTRTDLGTPTKARPEVVRDAEEAQRRVALENPASREQLQRAGADIDAAKKALDTPQGKEARQREALQWSRAANSASSPDEVRQVLSRLRPGDKVTYVDESSFGAGVDSPKAQTMTVKEVGDDYVVYESPRGEFRVEGGVKLTPQDVVRLRPRDAAPKQEPVKAPESPRMGLAEAARAEKAERAREAQEGSLTLPDRGTVTGAVDSAWQTVKRNLHYDPGTLKLLGDLGTELRVKSRMLLDPDAPLAHRVFNFVQRKVDALFGAIIPSSFEGPLSTIGDRIRQTTNTLEQALSRALFGGGTPFGRIKEGSAEDIAIFKALKEAERAQSDDVGISALRAELGEIRPEVEKAYREVRRFFDWAAQENYDFDHRVRDAKQDLVDIPKMREENRAEISRISKAIDQQKLSAARKELRNAQKGQVNAKTKETAERNLQRAEAADAVIREMDERARSIGFKDLDEAQAELRRRKAAEGGGMYDRAIERAQNVLDMYKPGRIYAPSTIAMNLRDTDVIRTRFWGKRDISARKERSEETGKTWLEERGLEETSAHRATAEYLRVFMERRAEAHFRRETEKYLVGERRFLDPTQTDVWKTPRLFVTFTRAVGLTSEATAQFDRVYGQQFALRYLNPDGSLGAKKEGGKAVIPIYLGTRDRNPGGFADNGSRPVLSWDQETVNSLRASGDLVLLPPNASELRRMHVYEGGVVDEVHQVVSRDREILRERQEAADASLSAEDKTSIAQAHRDLRLQQERVANQEALGNRIVRTQGELAARFNASLMEELTGQHYETGALYITPGGEYTRGQSKFSQMAKTVMDFMSENVVRNVLGNVNIATQLVSITLGSLGQRFKFTGTMPVEQLGPAYRKRFRKNERYIRDFSRKGMSGMPKDLVDGICSTVYGLPGDAKARESHIRGLLESGNAKLVRQGMRALKDVASAYATVENQTAISRFDEPLSARRFQAMVLHGGDASRLPYERYGDITPRNALKTMYQTADFGLNVAEALSRSAYVADFVREFRQSGSEYQASLRSFALSTYLNGAQGPMSKSWFAHRNAWFRLLATLTNFQQMSFATAMMLGPRQWAQMQVNAFVATNLLAEFGIAPDSIVGDTLGKKGELGQTIEDAIGMRIPVSPILSTFPINASLLMDIWDWAGEQLKPEPDKQKVERLWGKALKAITTMTDPTGITATRARFEPRFRSNPDGSIGVWIERDGKQVNINTIPKDHPYTILRNELEQMGLPEPAMGMADAAAKMLMTRTVSEGEEFFQSRRARWQSEEQQRAGRNATYYARSVAQEILDAYKQGDRPSDEEIEAGLSKTLEALQKAGRESITMDDLRSRVASGAADILKDELSPAVRNLQMFAGTNEQRAKFLVQQMQDNPNLFDSPEEVFKKWALMRSNGKYFKDEWPLFLAGRKPYEVIAPVGLRRAVREKFGIPLDAPMGSF